METIQTSSAASAASAAAAVADAELSFAISMRMRERETHTIVVSVPCVYDFFGVFAAELLTFWFFLPFFITTIKIIIIFSWLPLSLLLLVVDFWQCVFVVFLSRSPSSFSWFIFSPFRIYSFYLSYFILLFFSYSIDLPYLSLARCVCLLCA